MVASFTNFFLLILSSLTTVTSALATSTADAPLKSYLITGANKGQGYALCSRILSEHKDTHVFLCSRDLQRGEDAKQSLLGECFAGNLDEGARRVDVVQLDVTDDTSCKSAVETVRNKLGDGKLSGLV